MKIDTKSSREAARGDDYDLNRLDTGFTCEKGWFEIRPRGKLPEKRSHHTAVVHGNWMYVYGGEDSREGKYESLWKLNLDEFIEIADNKNDDLEHEENKDLDEEEEVPPTTDRKLHWRLVETSGAKPGPLSHHQAKIIGDDMYIFGGMKSDGECNDELYALNINSMEWRVVHCEGDHKPEGRDDHSMAQSDNQLFVFGGFVRGKRMNDLYQFDVESKTWT